MGVQTGPAAGRAQHTVETAKQAGKTALDPTVLDRYRSRYRRILDAGYTQNPEPERTGKRGRPRQGKPRSLLLRLDPTRTTSSASPTTSMCRSTTTKARET